MINSVEQARQILRENGYFVDNLWHIDDVKMRYKCEDEQAQYVLNSALTNEATVEQIQFTIDMVSSDEGFEPAEITD